ncbi:hypothetical protein SAMN00120144_2548 [Hymenobacter roseosalivarius DSM 11622]|uniref:DUF4920 domain-containing protein n=1 Tax=Hymenobacter roseosalivarius DSM 11622 TaxID=645990 RepID=A0A1W1W3F5_9BACT|nr:DUF4920 domain-containing protein [Hymenobacter roseosalivarius]SMC00157.1 hypothetical protein SAMN00120144_2548 [Hymenobacter roseosalivarius DSM 11622]
MYKSFLLIASLVVVACQSSPTSDGKIAASTPDATQKMPPSGAGAEGKTYGAPITAANAVPVAQLNQVLGTKDSAQVKLVGKATEVCQAKGCWMTIATADGQQMRVRFKDYGFFIPKDISGKTVVINGWAHRETVPISDLRHYATDAGKSEKEVAAITKPEQQLTFEADGVLVMEKSL